MPIIHPLNVGDIVAYIGDSTYINEAYEKNVYDALKRIMREEIASRQPDFVYKVFLHKIIEIKCGKITLANPITDDESRTESYNSADNYLIKYNKNKFEQLFKTNKPKFKVGDKVINPYLQLDEEIINDGAEWSKAKLDLSCYGIMAMKEGRVKFARSVPWLNIVNINPHVEYNIKYNKFLNTLTYDYVCTSSADFPGEIDFTATPEQIQLYNTYTSIWNKACTVPSPET